MPAADDSQETGSEVERVVMMALLDGRLFSRAELMREVAGSRGHAGDVEDAIEALYAAGLIHIIDGDFLLATRAAKHIDVLGL